MGEIRNFADELRRVHNTKPIPYLDDIVSNSSFSLLRFHNGSSLEITCAEMVQRGDRYNTVLLSPDIVDVDFKLMVNGIIREYERDEDCMDEYIMLPETRDGWVRAPYRFSPKKRTDYLTYTKWTDTKVVVIDQVDDGDDSSELDSFLNKFKINSQ